MYIFQTKFNKHFLSGITFLVVLYSLYLGSWHVANGSMYFFTDIARDFLLMEEIVEKKIVLLGPRASGMEGVFHGPLWLYLNMPAFLLGQGNPVVVGWFWVFLTVFFLAGNWIVTSKLLTRRIANIQTILLSIFIIPHMYSFYNPFGALFVLPFFFYFFHTYLKKQTFILLAMHVLLAGLIIQFQMAVGVPLLLLSLGWISIHIWQSRLFNHLLAYFVLLLPASTFLLFELRHNFAQFHSAINFITNKTQVQQFSLFDRLNQRVDLATGSGLNIFTTGNLDSLNRMLGIGVFAQLITNYLHFSKKELKIFLMACYFYIGFYLISLVFNGMLLVHYWIVLIPLSYLLVSMVLAKAKVSIGMPILGLIIFVGMYLGQQHVVSGQSNIGHVEDDWVFQQKIAATIFDQHDSEFGYFIFTPDVYAYESKYAMSYFTKNNPDKTVHVYEKKPVTYLIIAPIPKDRPDISSATWKKDRVGILREADERYHLSGNYVIEKYYLDDEEISVSSDPTIHDWVHFR